MEKICKINDTVLCYHFDKIYQAKCLDIKDDANGDPLYLVHYCGWNKKWDEWVPQARLLKFNPGGDSMATATALELKSKKSFKTPKNIKKITPPSDHENSNNTTSSNSTSMLTNDKRFAPKNIFIGILLSEKKYINYLYTSVDLTIDELLLEFHSTNKISIRSILIRYVLEINALVELNSRLDLNTLKLFKKPYDLDTIMDISEKEFNSIMCLTHFSSETDKISNSHNKSIDSFSNMKDQPKLTTATDTNKLNPLKTSNRKRTSKKLKKPIGFDIDMNIGHDNDINTVEPTQHTNILYTSSSTSLSLSKDNSTNINNLNETTHRQVNVRTFEVVCEVVEKMINIFNTHLKTHILYECEIPLYEQIRNKNHNSFIPSDIYGVAYLLRLLYKLEDLIKISSERSSDKVLYRTSLIYKDINVWLEKNIRLFLATSVISCTLNHPK